MLLSTLTLPVLGVMGVVFMCAVVPTVAASNDCAVDGSCSGKDGHGTNVMSKQKTLNGSSMTPRQHSNDRMSIERFKHF